MIEERIFRIPYNEIKHLSAKRMLETNWNDLEPAPPKDWQEILHKVAELTQYISETGDGTEAGFNSIDAAISRLKDVATLKQQIVELEDANRHLAKINDKLMAEKKKNTAWLDQVMNEGDGVYRP
jgi:hypothetical protein